MTSRLNCSLFSLTFVSILPAILLTWLHAAAAADKAISIPVQITHAQNFDPFPSPDGKKLVFISLITGKEQLFTMDADGSNVASLRAPMPITKIPHGHRMGPRSRSSSSPRTITASR